VNLGLLDLPAPMLDGLDAALRMAHLPEVARVALYATGCGWLSMWLYRCFSDQPRLHELRADITRTQRELATQDGEFKELSRLVRRNLALTLRQLGLTARPAMLASLPLLFVLPWLSNTFAVAPPAGTIHVCADPPSAAAGLHWTPAATAVDAGCWNVDLADGGQIRLQGIQGATLLVLPQTPQSTYIHKFTMFNWLIGNPDGYLPDGAPLQRLMLDLPARQLIGWGPVWLRGWEAWFFSTLMAVSVALKIRWKIH
jgi:hypothetical protein